VDDGGKEGIEIAVRGKAGISTSFPQAGCERKVLGKIMT
jgi:hypothetical protein